MSFKNKFTLIVINSIPILLMIALIPFIKNDFILTWFYILIILISLFVKYEKKDYVFFFFWFFVMIISESIFISTWVEAFNRNTLFWIMPLWLPFLWAYAFVTIKRGINILDK